LIDQPLFPHGSDNGAKPSLAEVRFAPHALDLANHAIDRRLRGMRIHDDNHAKLLQNR
jgi:hypothetical protein